MSSSLTRGSVKRMFTGDTRGFQPVIQVLSVRQISTTATGTRFRIVLSDGENYIQGMLSDKVHHYVSDETVAKYSINRLTDFLINNISGKRIVIVNELERVRQESSGIGSPKALQLEAATHSPTRGSRPAPPTSVAGGSSSAAGRRAPLRAYDSASSARTYGIGGSGAEPFQPVKSLNPYQQSWRIKVRCTKKDPMREYTNAKGPGKVFSVDLMDEETEIRATMFNDAATKWYPVFEKDGVYVLSRGKVQMARGKQYTHIKNDYSISLYDNSDVQRVDDDMSIKHVKYKFESIGNLHNVDEGEYVDVIGCVSDVTPVSQINTKRGGTTDKREVTVVDKTGGVRVTLWDKMAQELTEDMLQKQVLLLKSCRVSGFGGRSLSASSNYEISPTDNSQCQEMHRWGDSVHWDFSTIAMATTRGGAGGGPSQRLCIADAAKKAETELGASDDAAIYFDTVATVTSISHSREKPPLYKAAPGNETKAKVVDDGHGKYYCAKLNRTFDEYEPRYILRFSVTDHSGQQWMSSFHDEAIKILGTEASEVEALANDDGNGFERIFQKACFKLWKLRVRAKLDTYQDERRIRYQVVGANPVDLDDEIRHLEAKVAELEAL